MEGFVTRIIRWNETETCIEIFVTFSIHSRQYTSFWNKLKKKVLISKNDSLPLIWSYVEPIPQTSTILTTCYSPCHPSGNRNVTEIQTKWAALTEYLLQSVLSTVQSTLAIFTSVRPGNSFSDRSSQVGARFLQWPHLKYKNTHCVRRWTTEDKLNQSGSGGSFDQPLRKH